MSVLSPANSFRVSGVCVFCRADHWPYGLPSAVVCHPGLNSFSSRWLWACGWPWPLVMRVFTGIDLVCLLSRRHVHLFRGCCNAPLSAPARASVSRCHDRGRRTVSRLGTHRVSALGLLLRATVAAGQAVSPTLPATPCAARVLRQVSLMQHDGAPFRTVHHQSGVIHVLF